MKLNEQKTLLADVQAVTDDALKLYNAGVKIGGIVQKLRSVVTELESRIRFIERNSTAAKPQAKQAKPAKALEIENPKS